MTLELIALPLFVGPTAALLATLLLVVLVVVVARIVLGLAWRLLVLGAVVLAVLWLLGAVGTGPPVSVSVAPGITS